MNAVVSATGSEREKLLAAQAEEEPDWPSMLSTGEQQRLALARLLVHRPALALLDEASSALDVPNERRLYEQLARSVDVGADRRDLVLIVHHCY